MNYEEFSPEAKQAIEHLKKFLTANKNKIKIDYDDYASYIPNESYEVGLWMVLQRSALTYSVSFEEACDVAYFCRSKNYWLT